MKRLFTILLLLVITSAIKAQAQQPQKTAKPVMVMLPDSSNLTQLQAVLQFSYTWLIKSKAPADDVEQARALIQQLYPYLVPMKKDSTIKVPPKKTK